MIRVKPLNWRKSGTWSWGTGALCGTYNVRPCLATACIGQWLLTLNEKRVGDLYPSEEAAMAAAQSDYKSRVLSAVEEYEVPKSEIDYAGNTGWMVR